jgi:hypothetical protein
MVFFKELAMDSNGFLRFPHIPATLLSQSR